MSTESNETTTGITGTTSTIKSLNAINQAQNFPVHEDVQEENDEVKKQSTYVPGDTVEVAPRTWPGINQPGGVGRITGVSSAHATRECIRVSVRYVLDGRHEKEIDIKWVKPYFYDIDRPVSSKNSLRDRSMLLGRCQRCGSLRKDCGSCDFACFTNGQGEELTLMHSANNRSRSRRSANELRQIRGINAPEVDIVEVGNFHDEFNIYSEDSSEDSVEIMIKKDDRSFRRLKRWKVLLTCSDGSKQRKRKDASVPHHLLSTEVSSAKQKNPEEGACDLDRISSGDSGSEIGDAEFEVLKADFSESQFSKLQPNRSRVLTATMSDGSNIAFEISQCSSPGSPDFSEDENERPLPESIRYSDASDEEIGSEPQTLDDVFIQPEGSAIQLPSDIMDRTKTLQYDELGHFFDETIDKLEKDYIPSAKLKVYLLQKDLRNVNAASDSLSTKSLVSLNEIEKKSQELHEQLLIALIRNGTDQCEMALKKLGNRVRYQKFKESMLAKGLQTQSRNLDMRGFRLETIRNVSEGVLKQVRNLISKVQFQYEVANDDKSLSVSSAENYSEQSDSDQESICVSDHSFTAIDMNLNHQLFQGNFEPHPFASKKRRRRFGAGNKRLQKKSQNKDCLTFKRTLNGRNATKARKEVKRAQDNRGTSYSDFSDVENTNNHQAHNENQSRRRFRTKGKPRETSKNNRSWLFHSDKICSNDARSNFDLEGLSNEMRRFLEANPEKYIRKKPTRSIHQRKQKQANDNVKKNIDTISSGQGHRVDAVSSLFSYSENCELDDQDDCSIGKDSTDVPYLCIKLVKLFPKQSSRPILNAICRELTTSESITEAHAKTVFNAFVRLLRDRGCYILQDYLSSSNPFLCSHLTLLTSVLDLINAKCNTFLEPSDESFIVFSTENCSEFVNFILLQLVDAVMSLVHPDAWSLQLENNDDVLLELGNLRDSLGNFFLLQERVSQCVTRELGCQEWRCVREGEHFFVSAVNPIDWENFLTAGVKPHKITKSRYHAFDEKLPLCEARALWRLLDFFSRVPSLLVEDSVYSRWNLVSKLAIENTFSPLDIQPGLPLCEKQISAVLEDTERLRMLLLSGSMRSLPKQDNTLFEVIKRALECEAYNIRYNEVYREKSYPTIRDEIMVMKQLKHIWTIDNECKIPLQNSCPFKNIAIYLGKPEADSLWMEQPLCLPSSMLLQKSLGLLASWKSCLMRQESQNRCKRFELAVKTLIGSFLRQGSTTDCSKSQMKSEQNGHDPFRDAFSDVAHSKCGDAEKRHDLFFIECAMYTMSVIGSLPQQSGNNLIAVFEESWSIVSDDVMKSRRNKFMSSIPPKHELFQGDPYRLHVASRYLTCFALRSLGLNPFQGDFISFYFTPNPADTIALDMVTFSMILSSLIACLDCACDSNRYMEIISSIAGCVAIIFKSYCHVLSTEISMQTVQRADTLNKSFFPKLFQSIKRGLEIVTNVSCCGSEEHVCFQALLCCIRWALQAAVKINIVDEEEARMLTSSATIPNGTICEPAKDNEFDDMDDSLFASIDLTDIMGTRETVNDNSFEQMLEMYKLLEDFLHLGRPSITYSLAAHQTRVISVPGKRVINKLSQFVCCCLTQLVAARFCPAVESISILSLPRDLLTEDDIQDIRFKRKNCITLLRELCANEGNGCVNQLMYQRQGDIIYILLEALLSLDSCRKLPSRDIQFFRQLFGEPVGQEALTKLLNFASNDRNGEFRQLLKSNVATLGRVLLCTEENDWLSAWKVDSDFSSRWNVRILPSVEHECFNTFTFIRSLLFLGKKTQDRPLLVAYEDLLLSVVSVIARNLMDLYDAIQNHEPNQYLDSIPVTGKSYSYAFNMLLFNIYTDILTCLLSWAFRTQEKNDGMQTKLLQRIWDLFISPLLRQECFDLRAGLCLLSRNLQHSVSPTQLSSSIESEDLRKIMQISFIRRMQGFVLFFLKSEPETIIYSFLNDIFSFVLRTDEKARFLLLAVFSLDPASSEHDDVRSPLDLMQLELLDYMVKVEQQCPIDQNQAIALNKLTIVSYEQIIAPWLFQPNLDRDKKNSLIQALGEMLVIDTNNGDYNSMYTTIDLKLICKLCKGVAVSLKSGFISKEHVDEDRVCAVFSCYWSLLQIPSSRIEASAIGNVLDWCYPIAMSSDVDFGSSNDLYGNYIWYLSSWMKDLGRFILSHTLEEMDTFRNELALNDGILWQNPIPRQDVEVITNLFDFESKAFSKTYHSTDVKNMYAKKGSTASGVSYETWKPSKAVQKTVLNLVTRTAITNRCQ